MFLKINVLTISHKKEIVQKLPNLQLGYQETLDKYTKHPHLLETLASPLTKIHTINIETFSQPMKGIFDTKWMASLMVLTSGGGSRDFKNLGMKLPSPFTQVPNTS